MRHDRTRNTYHVLGAKCLTMWAMPTGRKEFVNAVLELHSNKSPPTLKRQRFSSGPYSAFIRVELHQVLDWIARTQTLDKHEATMNLNKEEERKMVNELAGA